MHGPRVFSSGVIFDELDWTMVIDKTIKRATWWVFFNNFVHFPVSHLYDNISVFVIYVSVVKIELWGLRFIFLFQHQCNLWILEIWFNYTMIIMCHWTLVIHFLLFLLIDYYENVLLIKCMRDYHMRLNKSFHFQVRTHLGDKMMHRHDSWESERINEGFCLHAFEPISMGDSFFRVHKKALSVILKPNEKYVVYLQTPMPTCRSWQCHPSTCLANAWTFYPCLFSNLFCLSYEIYVLI